jgi:hypothetical protein
MQKITNECGRFGKVIGHVDVQRTSSTLKSFLKVDHHTRENSRLT